MGAYKYVRELWRHKDSSTMAFLQRLRAWEYRQQSALVRVNRPSRPEKARALGFRSKKGYVVYRARIRRGGKMRTVPKGIVHGKPRNQGVRQNRRGINYRALCERRAGLALSGLRLLNSYWVAEDGVFRWYEIVFVDPFHAQIRDDPRINWICAPHMRHREQRALTGAGRKHRGLAVKGHRSNGLRPSKAAAWRKNSALTLAPRR